MRNYTMHDMRVAVTEAGVTLIGAGVDECPMAYKDIEQVMRAQTELCTIVGCFKPVIVRMSEDGTPEG
jgi:tRNA-splicing ligase RtcB